MYNRPYFMVEILCMGEGCGTRHSVRVRDEKIVRELLILQIDKM
jgi:hypothetical protein